MGSRFTITPPEDYEVARDVCSYGYFRLAPNRWDAERQVLQRVLDLDGGLARVEVAQGGTRGAPLTVTCDRALSRADKALAITMLRWMLHIDGAGSHAAVAAFHTIDPRWKKTGRGRIFRSPTFFEDLVKTVTSCNVTWAVTVTMNRRLCEVINAGFPRPEQLARRRAASLRSRCSVGYRDVRLIELGKMCVRGELDAPWFEDPANDDQVVYKRLLTLPGIGPYAAANMMQLLGRYGFLAIDSEALRHGREILGLSGKDGPLARRLRAHYEPFGNQKFRSYWFELWTDHERTNGPAHTWPERDAAQPRKSTAQPAARSDGKRLAKPGTITKKQSPAKPARDRA